MGSSLQRPRDVAARTVRKVWAVAAVAAVWLLTSATPALASSHEGNLWNILGNGFRWIRWAVLLIALGAALNVWRKKATEANAGGAIGIFKPMFSILAGAALLFFLFSQAGVSLLQSTGQAAAASGTVADLEEKDQINLGE